MSTTGAALVRFLHIFAFLIAAVVIAVAVVELDQRADEDSSALQPTTLPSPSFGPAQETDAPEETFTAPPIETDEDEPDSTPLRSVSPPLTPAPEPEGTAGPIVGDNGATPHTGASSVPAGVLIALVSLLGRALVTRRRRSY